MKITLTAITSLFILIVYGQEPVKWQTLKTEQAKLPTKAFTAAEWEEMTKNDEVKKFVDRVNAAAVTKDYWKEDFRRAFYDAFNEQFGKYAVEKYNHGEPFIINMEAAR